MSTTEDIKKTALRMLDAIDRRDWAGVKALSTPATAVKLGDQQLDVASWIGMGRMFYAAFSDARHEIESVAVEGDRVFLRCVWRATHRAEFQGVPATGKKVAVVTYVEERIVDGRVVEYSGLFDQTGLMQQLRAASTSKARGASMQPRG